MFDVKVHRHAYVLIIARSICTMSPAIAIWLVTYSHVSQILGGVGVVM